MKSASEVRNILDEIAVEVGIQKIVEKEYGNDYHDVYYLMTESASYFMNFRWYNSGSWQVVIADRIRCDSKIWTTGNTSFFPKGFDTYVVKMINDRLNELVTNYNKARKELKLKEILNSGAKYDV